MYCLRVAEVHSKSSSKPLQTQCRDLTEQLQKNTPAKGDALVGALACALRKPWRAHGETTANPLQEYPSGAAKSLLNHGIHVAEIK
jgi:hypothetical protein